MSAELRAGAVEGPAPAPHAPEEAPGAAPPGAAPAAAASGEVPVRLSLDESGEVLTVQMVTPDEVVVPLWRYETTRELRVVAAVIEIEGLQKHYHEVVAVADATFAVESGEIFGLLGSNGAGKTTTVECAQGLRSPTAGRVRVLGRDPRGEAAALRGRIGCQLQESRLPDHMKVWEALDLFASLTPGALDWRELMEQWGLAPKRNASFASLSGGQRQRLFIALALVSAPEVVFLDEMTTGLDPAARRVAWELIEEVRDRGTTVVLVTHFMDEAERLCDRVAVMDAGRIVATGHATGAGRRVRPLGARDLRQRRAGPGLAACRCPGRSR